MYVALESVNNLVSARRSHSEYHFLCSFRALMTFKPIASKCKLTSKLYFSPLISLCLYFSIGNKSAIWPQRGLLSPCSNYAITTTLSVTRYQNQLFSRLNYVSHVIENRDSNIGKILSVMYIWYSKKTYIWFIPRFNIWYLWMCNPKEPNIFVVHRSKNVIKSDITLQLDEWNFFEWNKRDVHLRLCSWT